MNEKLFNELIESIRDAGAYLRSERAETRVTFVGEPNPRVVLQIADKHREIVLGTIRGERDP